MWYVKSQRETKGYGVRSHLENKGYLIGKFSKEKERKAVLECGPLTHSPI